MVLPAVATFATLAAAPASKVTLPPAFEAYVDATVRLSGAERQLLAQGLPVAKLIEADPTREVAVFGAVWIAAPVDRYIRAVKDVEQLERGSSVVTTKRISDPPKLDDFATFDLPKQDVDALRLCRTNYCAVKLSDEALEQIQREVDWTKPTAHASVNAIIRQMALDYVNAYREGGNAGLAIYRDHARPTFVAQEFESMVGRMPQFAVNLTDLRRYLLEYPHYTIPGATDFFYWQTAVFGLKPTTRINHVVITQGAGGAVVASKQIYATHYFWTALELRVLIVDPARGNGFWYVNVSRSRSDGLSGMLGRLVGTKVRYDVQTGMDNVLRLTKARLEHQTEPHLPD